METIKKVAQYVLAGLSALIGIGTLEAWSSSKMFDAIFYIVLAVIIVCVRKSNQTEMIIYGLTTLTGVMGLGGIFSGNIYGGLFWLAVAAAIIGKYIYDNRNKKEAVETKHVRWAEPRGQLEAGVGAGGGGGRKTECPSVQEWWPGGERGVH
jgi:hypothetical protein